MMKVIATQYGVTIFTSCNMTIIPRIGETIEINSVNCHVKDVVWHIQNNTSYVEIKLS